MTDTQESSTKPLIFVVDDDDVFQELLATFLENDHFLVERFDSGRVAVETCKNRLPDLVMMDAIMPDMDGFSACKLLKTNRETKDIPVIMVTGKDDAESVAKAFSSGAEEYVTKPIQWPVLRQRVRVYMERKKNLLALQESEERFRSVTDSTVDAIISADENGLIVFWNKGAEKLFGYQSTEILGQSVLTLIPEQYREEYAIRFDRLMNPETSRFRSNVIEMMGIRKDGIQFPQEMTITSWHAADKKYISAVIRDITDRKQAMGGRDGVALFDRHIIEQIYFLWRQMGSRDSGHLTFQKLKSIMEVVFLAGIQNEEGIPIRLAVSFVDVNYFDNGENAYDNTVLHFEDRLPFVLDSVVKVACAFDPETTVLAVSGKRDDQESLEIWGAIFTSVRGKTRLDPFPFVPDPLDAIIVSSIRAGSLTISWGDQVLATFNAGHFSEMSIGLDAACPIYQTMIQEVHRHPEYEESGKSYWSIYREMLKLLVGEASKRCHGGTIIWLPEKELSSVKHSLLTRYPLFQKSHVPSAIADLCAMEKERNLIHSQANLVGYDPLSANIQILEDTINECKKRLVDHIELLAQLICADGALILTHAFSPLSFGSVLLAPQWLGDVNYCETNLLGGNQSVNLAKYGTRHTSAVNFVGKFPGVVAIVISQDGPISGLVCGDENTILWQSDFMSSKAALGWN